MNRLRIGTTVAAAFSLLLSLGYLAWACSCPRPSLKNAMEHSSAVFTGKVLKIVKVADKGLNEVTFQVDRQWKGISSREMTIQTSVSGASCGYEFEVGTSYLVFAKRNGEDPTLSTTICTRNAALKDAQTDIEELGPSVPMAERK